MLFFETLVIENDTDHLFQLFKPNDHALHVGTDQ